MHEQRTRDAFSLPDCWDCFVWSTLPSGYGGVNTAFTDTRYANGGVFSPPPLVTVVLSLLRDPSGWDRLYGIVF